VKKTASVNGKVVNGSRELAVPEVDTDQRLSDARNFTAPWLSAGESRTLQHVRRFILRNSTKAETGYPLRRFRK
jgi:hypothetical protein